MLFEKKYISIPFNESNLKERNQRLAFILEISNFLATSQNLQDLLSGALKKVLEHFELDAGRIYLMDDDGANPLRLTYNDSSDYAPVWSPDGSRIAFVSKRDGNWEIYVMNADGTESERLTHEDATDFAPAWSPDGKLIAFESYRDGDMEIYVMAADGSDQTNLTQFPRGSDHGPTWAPDGEHIAYYSNRAGGWDVFVVDLAGSGDTNLTLSQATEQTPSWQPWSSVR